MNYLLFMNKFFKPASTTVSASFEAGIKFLLLATLGLASLIDAACPRFCIGFSI